MKADEQLELLRSCVALRVEGRKVRESVRRELAAVEAALVGVLPRVTRKTVAARLLDCSVQALDRHIAKGRIAVEPTAEGSTRMAIPTDDLIDIAYEQALDGRSIGHVIAAAQARSVRTVEFRDVVALINTGDRWARLMRDRTVV